MTQSAIFEPQSLDLEHNKPWERQEGEPARWFLRFRNYLKLGPRRSVNAVFERERQEKAGWKATNKAGTRWYDTALRWQWEARAEAYDAHVDTEKAAAMREIAARMPFVSRPFRLVQLNSLAISLMRVTEPGRLDADTFLAVCKTMQSLMHDIAEEVSAWGVPIDHTADSAALMELTQRNLRLKDFEQERELDQEAEIDRLMMKAQLLDETLKRRKHAP